MASQPKDFPNQFQDKAKDLKDKAKDVKDQVTDRAREMKDNAKESMKDAGRKAADKIDAEREPAARGLENAASAIHQKADSLPGGEKVASIAHSAANKMQSTADYVRMHDMNDMMHDAEDFVRRYPAQMLGVAAVLGFLIGRAFRDED